MAMPPSKQRGDAQRGKRARGRFGDLSDDERSSGNVEGRSPERQCVAAGQEFNPTINDRQWQFCRSRS